MCLVVRGGRGAYDVNGSSGVGSSTVVARTEPILESPRAANIRMKMWLVNINFEI